MRFYICVVIFTVLQTCYPTNAYGLWPFGSGDKSNSYSNYKGYGLQGGDLAAMPSTSSGFYAEYPSSYVGENFNENPELAQQNGQNEPSQYQTSPQGQSPQGVQQQVPRHDQVSSSLTEQPASQSFVKPAARVRVRNQQQQQSSVGSPTPTVSNVQSAPTRFYNYGNPPLPSSDGGHSRQPFSAVGPSTSNQQQQTGQRSFPWNWIFVSPVNQLHSQQQPIIVEPVSYGSNIAQDKNKNTLSQQKQNQRPKRPLLSAFSNFPFGGRQRQQQPPYSEEKGQYQSQFYQSKPLYRPNTAQSVSDYQSRPFAYQQTFQTAQPLNQNYPTKTHKQPAQISYSQQFQPTQQEQYQQSKPNKVVTSGVESSYPYQQTKPNQQQQIVEQVGNSGQEQSSQTYSQQRFTQNQLPEAHQSPTESSYFQNSHQQFSNSNSGFSLADYNKPTHESYETRFESYESAPMPTFVSQTESPKTEVLSEKGVSTASESSSLEQTLQGHKVDVGSNRISTKNEQKSSTLNTSQHSVGK